MNEFTKNNTTYHTNDNGYFLYASIGNYANPINFYDHKDKPTNNVKISFDGYEYHILCKKDFYDSCIKGNSKVTEELAENLQKMKSIRFNFKYFLRVLMVMIILLIPVSLSIKFLIYNTPYEVQSRIVNIVTIMAVFYLLGHLIRVFIMNKYKNKTYKTIFNTLDNQEYKQQKSRYYLRYYYPSSSQNPLKSVFLKNVFRIIFYFVILFFLYSLFCLITGLNIGSKVQLDELKSTFLVVKEETNYEITNKVSNDETITGTLKGYDNYIIERFHEDNNVVIRDKNLTKITSLDEIVGDYEYIDFIELEKDILLFNHTKEEYISDEIKHFEYFTLYNLKTEEEMYTCSVYKGIENVENECALEYIHDFDYVDGRLFLLGSRHEESYYSYNQFYSMYEVIDNELVFLRNLPASYTYNDFRFIDNMFYYTMRKHDDYYDHSYLGRGSMDTHDFKINTQKLSSPRRFIDYNGKTYLKGGAIYTFDQDLNIETLAYGLYTPDSYNVESLFVLGSYIDSVKLVREDGSYIAQSIPHISNLSTDAIYYLDNEILTIVSNKKTYTLEKSDHITYHYDSFPDLGLIIDEFNLTQDSVNNYILLSLTLVTLFPYLRITSILLRKNKLKKLLSNDYY